MHQYPVPRRRRHRVQLCTTQQGRSLGNTTQPMPATVITIIDPSLRASVDGATDAFQKVHVSSVSEAVRAISQHSARALLLSPEMIAFEPLAEVAKMVLRSPGVTPIAVLGFAEPTPVTELLGLGACGVRELVDLSHRSGWDRLRGILDDSGGPAASCILSSLMPMLEDTTDEARHFFASLVRVAPSMGTVRKLATVFGISPSTLMSRFFRARLPAPKAYLAMTRLMYAAWFFEVSPDLSIVDVSNALDFSSPQSFGRHIRHTLGLTAGEFRSEFSVARGVSHFAERLIDPYRTAFQSFNPIGPTYLRAINGIPQTFVA